MAGRQNTSVCCILSGPCYPELSQITGKEKVVTISSKHSSPLTSCRNWRQLKLRGKCGQSVNMNSSPHSAPHHCMGWVKTPHFSGIAFVSLRNKGVVYPCSKMSLGSKFLRICGCRPMKIACLEFFGRLYEIGKVTARWALCMHSNARFLSG